MPRARNIKPGFFRNADLVELPFEARLLFIGLWTLADREGRLEDRPKQIKMEIFPADNVDCDALIGLLEGIGVVARYEHGGKRYLQVVNFCKHQNPHRDEKASTIPDQHGNLPEPKEAPSKHRANTVQAPCKEDADTVAIGLIPDSLIPDSLTKEEATASVASAPVGTQATTQQTACPADAIVALYHEILPDNPRCKVLSDARRAAIRARWKEAAKLTCAPFGYSSRADGLVAWRRFFEVCAESDFLTGRAPGIPGKPPFIADIDFLMSPSGFAKTLENKYHREVAA